MVPLLLLPLLWGGSLQETPGYELRLKEDVTVQEGLCVHVPCSFSYPWSSWSSRTELYIYWYWSGDNIHQGYPVATNKPRATTRPETSGRFRLLEDPTTNSCSLNISDARMSDTGSYFFRVERGYSVKYNYGDKKLNLQVTGMAGARRGPGAGGPHLRTGTGDRNTPCPGLRVGGGKRHRTWDAPKNLTIHIFSRNVSAFEILQTTSPLLILEGQALRLLCAADSNPPAALSWFWGSPALNATPISSTAILELPRVGTAEEGELTCQARHPLGSPSVSLNLSVVYPPQVSCSWEDKWLHCRCSSRAKLASSVHWRLGEWLLEGNFSNASFKVTFSLAGPWTNSSLSLSEGLSSSLRLSCETGNVHGGQSTTVLLLPGQGICWGQTLWEKGVDGRK
ncbi:PREDICTED: sialic acid-binding Ig-like lectin 5 [Hipposideros armiger]|uniref:Sialic acid-binding Ig-like lectin 5 n=1 Tax=Hipposideros armiger TaxID=186990 RepID=A0A8B7QPP0_HIPAR|nr:PREDICTED: sialic acid-binding Ig-like lectin 5 [Hipposideros armiger]